MKRAMKGVAAATALTLFGIAPGIASACEYADSMAKASTPAQLVLAPAPAATKVPVPAVVKAPAPKATTQVSAKVEEAAPDAKVAVVSTR